MPNSTSTSSSQQRLATCTKLRFLAQIRRFIKSKSFKPISFNQASSTAIKPAPASTPSLQAIKPKEDDHDRGHVNDDGGSMIVLQRSVKKLHFGNREEKKIAAVEIKRLAQVDAKLKEVMAELGVIPSLVSMAESEAPDYRSVSIQALIELSNGSYRNKVLMVEAGVLKKLPENITASETTMQEYAQLLLSISSLSNSQLPLTTLKLLPFLLAILVSTSRFETKELCLSTIYNFSTVLENAASLVSNGLVPTLLTLSSITQTSEKSLATLANLVVTLMGKRAMENSSESVPQSLIEILTWEDRPKCQELSTYILMILAHQSSAQRQKMSKLGIVPVLLEVVLVGNSQLAQKRAMKLLQWFKDEREVRMRPHSGPQTARVIITSPVNKKDVQVEKKLMSRMVKESLNKNMEIITRRAKSGFEEGSLKSLVVSTRSKSLPY